MLATVRMVAVAVVTPPTMPQAMLAMPWPNNSRLLLWRSETMVSATKQVSRESNAHSPASAMAGPNMLANWLALGMYRVGRPDTISRYSISRWNKLAVRVPTNRATNGAGNQRTLAKRDRRSSRPGRDASRVRVFRAREALLKQVGRACGTCADHGFAFVG